MQMPSSRKGETAMARTSKKMAVALLAVSAVLCAAVAGCAPQEVSQPKANIAGSPAQDMAYASEAWDANADCTQCHVGFHSARPTDLGATHIVATADSDNPVACIDCHQDSAELKAVHESADTEDIDYTVTADVCLTCHDQATLVQATSDSYTILDAGGNPVNPHAVHAPEMGAKIDCLSCHDGHYGQVSEQDCFTCHHTQTIEGCASCHRSPEAYADFLTDEFKAANGLGAE